MAQFIKHGLRLSTLAAAVALVGCGENFKDCNGFWDKTFGRDSCHDAGVKQVALTGMVSAGTAVSVKTIDGRVIGTSQTQPNGSYSVTVPQPYLVDPIVIEATGGTLGGQPFTGKLTATFAPTDGTTNLSVTPLTTLVDHLALIESGDALAKRNAAVAKLVSFGMASTSTWHSVSGVFDLDAMAFRIAELGGVNQWLAEIATDLADGELSVANMRSGFFKAHGGIEQVRLADDGVLSVISGDAGQIAFSLEGADVTSFKNLTISLEDAPSWLKVEGQKIVYQVPELAQQQTADRINFKVKIAANGVVVGRSVNASVYVVPTVTLLEGELTTIGGKIENQWKDIWLTVEPNVLKSNYAYKLIAGVDDGGTILFRTQYSSATLTDEEKNAITLHLPDADLLLNNYLNGLVVEPQPSPLRASARSSTGDSSTLPSFTKSCAYDRNGKDQSFQDAKWPTSVYNYPFTIIDENMAYFEPNGRSHIEDPKGVNNAYFGRQRISAPSGSFENLCSSRLWGLPVSSDREPVLFVHGFSSNGEMGAYDLNDNGSLYWGAFPNLADKAGYVPYVFEWKTNARFDDVSRELGKAVELIKRSTGKKVHIVAHSFGGLLSRTLVQGLSKQSDSDQSLLDPTYTRNWAESSIASLTTVGTPHSGITDDGYQGLPNGQDGTIGDLIDFCDAVTCYQAGVAFGGGGTANPLTAGSPANYHQNTSLHKTTRAQTIMSINGTPYPDIKTQVLIGVGREDMEVTCNLNSSSDPSKKCKLFFTKKAGLDKQGDGLISFYGQRFYPDAIKGRGSALLKYGSVNRNVREHILDFNAAGAVGLIDTYFQSVGSPDFWSDVEIPHYGYDLRRTPDGIEFTHPKSTIVIPSKSGYGTYNHRTGQYKENLLMPHAVRVDYPLAITEFSEVGLQNCDPAKPDSCNHATWKYFKLFVLENPATTVPQAVKITASGRLNFAASSTTARFASRMAVAANTVPEGTTVTIYANSRFLAKADILADGSFSTPVEFNPNTDYTLRIHAPGYRAKVIRSSDLGIATGDTAAQSRLDFGVINMETMAFAAGDMKVVVTDAVTGRPVSGYTVKAYNGVNNNVASKTETETTTAPTPTLTALPKGSYRLEITKNGYQTAKQICEVNELVLNTCQINIVPIASLAEGQLVTVLRWDVDPSDLDSHLIKYDAQGNKVYNIFYGNRGVGEDNLDVDDTSSFGPETVTINQVDPTAKYIYAVHHYGGSGSITSTSQAKVSVLKNNEPVKTYNAPLSGDGEWWKVFEVINGRVIPCQTNCVLDVQPSLSSARTAFGQAQPRWLQDMSRNLPSKK